MLVLCQKITTIYKKIKVKHDMNHCFGFFIYSGNEKGADGDP